MTQPGEPSVTPLPGEILDGKQGHEALQFQFAYAAYTGKHLSIITADINALKAVNDELGHGEGDALIELVETVIGVIPASLRRQDTKDERSTDIVSLSPIDYSPFESLEGMEEDSTAARVGGDEFLIILPETDERGAEAVAERIHKTFNETLAGSAGDKFRARGINVGLALGTASLKTGMTSSSDLLRLSDARMYEHKMSQLRPLNEEQTEHLLAGLRHLNESGVRPRDLPRYIEWLGQKGLQHALSEDSQSD